MSPLLPSPKVLNIRWQIKPKFITKIFKDTNVSIAYTTNNSIGKHLAPKKTPRHTYDQCGIYKLTCPDCNMTYTGQTGRPFKIRFNEHANDFKYNNRRSKFALHLTEEGHAFGKMEDLMEVIHVTGKGKMMNTIENFHIYKETKTGNQINDKMTSKENRIFETIILHDPQWVNHSYTHIRDQSWASNRPSQREYTTKRTGSEPDHKTSLQEPVILRSP